MGEDCSRKDAGWCDLMDEQAALEYAEETLCEACEYKQKCEACTLMATEKINSQTLLDINKVIKEANEVLLKEVQFLRQRLYGKEDWHNDTGEDDEF